VQSSGQSQIGRIQSQCINIVQVIFGAFGYHVRSIWGKSQSLLLVFAQTHGYSGYI